VALTEQLRVLIEASGGGAIREFQKVGKAAQDAHNKIAKAQGDTERSTSRLGSLLSKVGVSSGAALGAGIAAGATVALGAIVKFGSESLDTFSHFGSGVRRLQVVTGQSAEDASRLAVAFKILGVDTTTATVTLSRLGKNIFENDAKLRSLGVTIAKDQQNRTDLHGTLLNIADAYRRTADPAQRAELAFAAFGRGAQAILPLLAKGKDGIQALEKEADRFGLTLSEKGVASAKAFALSQKEVGLAVAGLKVQVGEQLAPEVTDTAIGFSRLAGFVDRNVHHLGGLKTVLGVVAPSLALVNRLGHQGADAHHALAEAAIEAEAALEREVATASGQVGLLTGLSKASTGVEQAKHNLALAQHQLTEAERGGARSSDDLRAAHERQKAAQRDMASAIKAQTHAQEGLTKAQQAYEDALHADHTRDFARAAFDVREAQLALEDAQNGLTDAITAHGDGSLEARHAQLQLEEATQRLADTQEEAGNIQKDADEKIRQAHEQVESATEALADANDRVTEAQDRLNDSGQRTVREAPDVVAARLAVKQAHDQLKDATAAALDAQTKLNAELEGMNASKASAVLTQMQPLLDALRLNGENPDELPLIIALRKLAAEGFEDAFARAVGRGGAPGTPTTQSRVQRTASPEPFGFGGVPLPKFAKGGVVPGPTGAARLAIVHGGENITPPGAGGTINLTVNGAPGQDAAELARLVRDELLKLKRRNVTAALA
jgi:hypothetical protein